MRAGSLLALTVLVGSALASLSGCAQSVTPQFPDAQDVSPADLPPARDTAPRDAPVRTQCIYRDRADYAACVLPLMCCQWQCQCQNPATFRCTGSGPQPTCE